MSDFLSGLISVLTPVRGSGVVIEETRPLEGIHGVTLETSGNLVIRLGETEQIILRGEDNILPLIDTPVRDGRLKIRYKTNTSISIHRNLEFILTVKNLDWIETTSSGDIDIPDMDTAALCLAVKSSGSIDTGKIRASSLQTVQSSSGPIELENLETPLLKSEITGSGNLLVRAGQVQGMNLKMTSAGGLKAPDLQSAAEPAARVDIEIIGSGNAEIGSINAIETNFRLTSAGNLMIHHLNTGLVTAQISGSGNVSILAGSAACQQMDLSSAGKYLANDLTATEASADNATFKVSGSGSAFPGEIRAGNVQLNLTSGGSLLARRLECVNLTAGVKGSGNVSIEEGYTDGMDLRLTSAGSFSFRQMQDKREAVQKAAVRVSGSGNARLGTLFAGSVELTTESSGDIRVETMQTDEMKAELKGSGSIHIQGGSARLANILVSSAGDFKALEWTTETAIIRSTGSGRIKLSVKDRLDAIVNSSGDVTYRGKPIVSYSKDGSGEIKRAKS